MAYGLQTRQHQWFRCQLLVSSAAWGCMAISVPACGHATTASSDPRFQFPSRSAASDPACQSAGDNEVAPLECFCAGGSCPANLERALEVVTAQCADGSCTAIRSDDNCGQARIIVGTGAAESTYVYRTSDGSLTGAEHFVDCCRRFNIITSRTTSCPIVSACLLAGRRDQDLSKLQPCAAAQ